MKLRVGQTITVRIAGIEQVELLEELGSGGNGHVWKVQPRIPAQQTYYALKHIAISPDLSPEERDDYLHRIRCEASVNVASEYIIKCLGLCEPELDNFVFLFPYTPGQDLAKWLQQHRDRPWADKQRIFLNILHGVRALHQAKILHRDLKPKNIFITAPGETPVILDFGLAKFRTQESVTDIGTIAGTDAYIAPEVFGWGGIKEVDERCDIYALGVILYEMIVGKNPWRANNWDFGDFAHFLQAQDANGKNRYHNLLEIDQQFSADADPVVREVVWCSTMFEPMTRLQTVDDVLAAIEFPALPAGSIARLREIPLHTGDTGQIARQALAHEREEHTRQGLIRTSNGKPPRSPNTHPQRSMRFLRRMFTALVVIVVLMMAAMGIQSLSRWWRTHQSSSSSPSQSVPTPKPVVTVRPTITPRPRPNLTPTPSPRPRATPTLRPRPTLTPKPKPTTTPTSKPTINEQELRELLRRNP